MKTKIAAYMLLTLCMLAGSVLAQNEGDRKFVEKFKEKLPAGYTVKFELYPNSDRVQSVTPLNPQGQPDGEAIVKAQYGWEILRSIPYKNGIQEGVEKEFEFGEVEGKRVLYLRKETPWLAGKVHGVKKLFHPNGRVMSESSYVNGITDGPSRNYDLSGRLEREAHFKNGKREGTMTEYWTLTGKPKNIIPYKLGKVDGLVQEFFDSGKLKKEVTLKDDEFHGVEKRFDEDGALLKTVYWLRDKEVSKQAFEAGSKAP
ncbi:MAG: hypothetical protein AMXMBFR7_51070 [Planctomycetota bacterium]